MRARNSVTPGRANERYPAVTGAKRNPKGGQPDAGGPDAVGWSAARNESPDRWKTIA